MLTLEHVSSPRTLVASSEAGNEVSRFSSVVNVTPSSYGECDAQSDMLQQVILVIVRESAPTRAFHTGPRNATVANQMEQALQTIMERHWCVLSDQSHNSAIRNLFLSDYIASDWMKIACETVDDLPISKIGDLITDLSRHLHQTKFDSVNERLLHATVDRMSLDALSAISRITASAKDSLSAWPEFVCRARKEMKRRGEKGPHLVGL